jgi:hypothetical protein
MQADLTVTKLEENKFMVVATDTMHNTTQNYVKRLARLENKEVVVQAVTGFFFFFFFFYFFFFSFFFSFFFFSSSPRLYGAAEYPWSQRTAVDGKAH